MTKTILEEHRNQDQPREGNNKERVFFVCLFVSDKRKKKKKGCLLPRNFILSSDGGNTASKNGSKRTTGLALNPSIREVPFTTSL